MWHLATLIALDPSVSRGLCVCVCMCVQIIGEKMLHPIKTGDLSHSDKAACTADPQDDQLNN